MTADAEKLTDRVRRLYSRQDDFPSVWELADALDKAEAEIGALRDANEHANRMQRATMDERDAIHISLSEAEATIASLRDTLDQTTRAMEAATQRLGTEVEERDDTIASLIGRLEPFAEEADQPKYVGVHDDTLAVGLYPRITVGQLRAARAALSAPPQVAGAGEPTNG